MRVCLAGSARKARQELTLTTNWWATHELHVAVRAPVGDMRGPSGFTLMDFGGPPEKWSYPRCCA